MPGTLNLIVLTHGDYDHAGNAYYLREKYKTKIAIHRDDAGRVERGDWGLNMKPKPDKFGLLFRMVSLFIKPGPFDTFAPDVYLEDGQAYPDSVSTRPSFTCLGTRRDRSVFSRAAATSSVATCSTA